MKSEFLAYWSVRIFGAFVRFLPISIAIAIGRFAGRIGYYFDRKRKKTVYANLKIAFAGKKEACEIKLIARKFYCQIGQHAIELLRLPMTDPQRFIQVEGKEHVDLAMRKGKGVILSAMHFGSWELCNFIEKLLGYPYRVMVNPQPKHSRLDEMLNSYRKKVGAGLLYSSRSGTRDFLSALKRNEMIGMILDQGGKEGVLVKFFGRLASMSTGALKMALKLDVPICFCTIVHRQGPYHRLIIHPPLRLVRSNDIDQDIREGLEQIMPMMEQYVKQYPWQYMWFYKTWKYSKESVIVILNDKRVGHLRQSQSVAQRLKGVLRGQGIESHIQVIDIEFKDKMRRGLFTAFSFLKPEKFFKGQFYHFKWFLKRKSYIEVMSVKGDFVISCGSSTASLNDCLSHDYHAKNIVIQRPGFLDFSRFNLVILPKHDYMHFDRHRSNVVFTDLAPNLVNKEYLEDQTQKLVKKFPILRSRKKITIGALIGGESKYYFISLSQAKVIASNILKAAEQLDASVCLTTSRRTSPEVEEEIVFHLKGHLRCPMMIQANKNNVPEAVGGILGLSDIVVVSSDSISMVSEAVSSGKKVIVILAQKRGLTKETKHERFIRNLIHQGSAAVATPDVLSQTIIRLSQSDGRTNPICDEKILSEAVRKVI